MRFKNQYFFETGVLPLTHDIYHLQRFEGVEGVKVIMASRHCQNLHQLHFDGDAFKS